MRNVFLIETSAMIDTNSIRTNYFFSLKILLSFVLILSWVFLYIIMSFVLALSWISSYIIVSFVFNLLWVSLYIIISFVLNLSWVSLLLWALFLFGWGLACCSSVSFYYRVLRASRSTMIFIFFNYSAWDFENLLTLETVFLTAS